MPLIGVTVEGTTPVAHGTPEPLSEVLSRNISALPQGAPIVVLIHGYKYSPFVPGRNPHETLLSLDPHSDMARVVSWPRHLGFGTDDAAEGLCISLGWHARGRLKTVFDMAPDAGLALAKVLGMIQRPVSILTHSMGARVALTALPHANAGSVRRLVMLSAADYQSTAAAALTSPAGQAAEFVNVTSRENDLFDFLLDLGVNAPWVDRTLGHGLLGSHDNWLDIQLDDASALDGLGRLGYPIEPARNLVCHWSTYLRPGALAFYAALMRNADRIPLPWLKDALPGTSTPRWSRFRARKQASRALQPG
ncbi:MAG: hypothetical protein AAFX00_04965 [Pseudomonadota bacterium]